MFPNSNDYDSPQNTTMRQSNRNYQEYHQRRQDDESIPHGLCKVETDEGICLSHSLVCLCMYIGIYKCVYEYVHLYLRHKL